MISVSATTLRNNLFNYLDNVAEGESVTIRRNNEDVAFLVPAKSSNWRNKKKYTAKLLVSPEEAFAPMNDVWADIIL